MQKHKPYRSKKYLDWVKLLPSSISYKPAECYHHIIGHGVGGMGTKASDLFTLPLTFNEHTGNEGIHTHSVEWWENRWSSQWVHVAKTLKLAILEGIITEQLIFDEIEGQITNSDDKAFLKLKLGLDN